LVAGTHVLEVQKVVSSSNKTRRATNFRMMPA
jgi:hypothetical protein